MVKGESLSSLPPSVMAVLESDRNGGSFRPLQNAVLGEWDIATEHAVNGSRTLSLPIEEMTRFRETTVIAAVVIGPAAAAAVASRRSADVLAGLDRAEFLQGEVENLSIDSYGRLSLGPATTRSTSRARRSCGRSSARPTARSSSAAATKGRYSGLTPTARRRVLRRRRARGPRHRPGTGRRHLRGDVTRRQDLQGRRGRHGAGLACSSIRPSSYIWSLAVDRAGNVFAGTGDKGLIYKMARTASGAPFYSTKATHVMTLAFDREGRLLAGTESPGRVFQIDAAGQAVRPARLALQRDPRCVSMPKGDIYAAAVTGRGAQAPDRAPAQPDPPRRSADCVGIDRSHVDHHCRRRLSRRSGRPGSTADAPRNPGPGAGAVYRIMPDGASDLVWQPREDAPYDLAFEPGGTVLVATGNEGKIYRLAGDPMQPTLVARATGPADHGAPARSLRACALRHVESRESAAVVGCARRTGHLHVRCRDAQSVATWGAIKWQAAAPAGTKVEISTRSGNTRTADETWSDWSSAYADPNGTPIVSPRARYLQWRAVLTADREQAPVLTSVTAAYLPRNTRPRVTSDHDPSSRDSLPASVSDR